MLVFEKYWVIFCTKLLFCPFLFFFWTKLHLTLFFPAQMATPGRRLCTSGKGAQLRLGTFARGGSTSSPSWAWETPPRLSGLSQVRKKKSIPFDHKLLMAHSVKADWSLCHWHPACVAGQSCVCQNWLLKHKGASQEERSHRCCMTQHLCWAWYN